MEESEANNLVIGCYSEGKQAPSLFFFDAKEKKAEAVLTQINPSYVLKSNDHYYVAAQHPTGVIVTLNSKFEVLSRVQSMGDDPCHLSIDNTGNFIVACNYSSASVLICKLTQHKPSSVHSFINHEGSSVNPDRQSSPHPHSSVFSEDNDVLFIADLGTDIVYYYEFNPQKITWQKEKSIRFEGTGPRTLCRGKPGSKLLYLSCELDNTIRVLSYANHKLEQIIAYKVSQTQLNYPSEVCWLNDRVFLGLRGEDKVMIFDVKEDNKLQQFCAFKVGEWPRHFSVTPGGYLYVACQKGNLIQKYKVSSEKIVLHSQLSVTTPSCVIVV